MINNKHEIIVLMPKTEDVVKVGDTIVVKAIGPDKKGRQNFSRKEALAPKKSKK